MKKARMAANPLGPLWLCDGEDGQSYYLRATDPDQIERDFPDLEVIGELIAVIEVDDC